MADVSYYFKLADGTLIEKTRLSTQPAPPTPAGATVLTLSAYNTARAALDTAYLAEQSSTRTAEKKATALRGSAPARLVASATAPAAVKAAASYICDGLDDQVQIIQALTDTLADGGGKVILSAGVFLLNDNIQVPPGEGLTLGGVGWDTVLKNAGGSNRYAVFFTGGLTGADTRMTIQDLMVDGNYFEQTTGGGGIWAQGAVQCHFTNIKFTSCWDDGLHLGPISATAFGHTNYVTNCLFEQGMGSPGNGVGIHMTSNDENFIIGCDFEFMGGAVGVASGIYDQAGTQFVQACNFVGGREGKSSVRIQNAHNTRVNGCNFDGTGGDGVFISGSGCAVVGNTFFGVGIIGAAGQSSGVYLEFAAANNVVTGNVLATHTVDGAAHSLIREPGDGDAGRNLVTSNQLLEKGTAAFGLLDLHGVGTAAQLNMGVAGLLPNYP